MNKEQRKNRGQGLVEYALILGLVAIIVIVIVAVFGTEVSEMYKQVIDNWPA